MHKIMLHSYFSHQQKNSMKFSNTNPPQETQRDEYPKLDEVVTVSNCFYYLSLLERFVQTTRNMPEDILKKYLVRAEYRYFKWAYCSKKSYSSVHNVVPPLGRKYS